jgi:hypothetical protein
MPERWERELRRLNEVDAPVSEIRSRGDEPPRGDGGSGLPPTRQRVVAGVVAFGVFIAAASFGWLALRPMREADVGAEQVEPSRLVLTTWADPATERPGTIVLTVDGRSIDGSPGGFSMGGTDEDGTGWSTIGDAVGPTFSKEDFVPVTADAVLEVRGNHAEVHASVSESADVDGRHDRFDAMSGHLPQLAVGYHVIQFGVRWEFPDLMITNTWFFPIEVVAASTNVADATVDAVPPPDDPDANAPEGTSNGSDVLRIRCDGDTVVVETPVVRAQPDGVHVEVVPTGGERVLTFWEAGAGRATFGGRVAADGKGHPWPIAPGAARVACGPTLGPVAEAAAFEVVDPDGNWATGELSCGDAARAEVVGYDGGATRWVDEEAMIRGILRGVRETDRIVPASYGRDRLARWVILRDGAEVGVVVVTWVTDGADPQGGGLGRIDGVVCAAAGIDGTVHPRDPDGDGVTLDCMAANQVAFRHRGGVLLPSGETFIRANVPGIRPTDELVAPIDGGGDDGYEGIWRVEREGKTVASVDYRTLDGITCRWNAIGIDPNDL